jgi:uncharacterized membrane protein YfcA
VANVAGSVAGVLVSMLNNGEVGLAIAAAFLTAALVSLVARRRRRILAAREEQYVPRRRPRPVGLPGLFIPACSFTPRGAPRRARAWRRVPPGTRPPGSR